MHTNQQLKKFGFLYKVPFSQRALAGILFLGFCGFFTVLFLCARGKIDINRWLTPCGFKQNYDLPCPTCGMTASALAFASGRIIQSFYIQPAGGMLCTALALGAFLSFFVAVSGRNFNILKRFSAEIKLKYVVLALIFIIICAWAVTLARTFAEK